MAVDEDDFPVADVGVAFLQADPAFADGFDFAALEDDAGFERFQDFVVEPGGLVDRDRLHRLDPDLADVPLVHLVDDEAAAVVEQGRPFPWGCGRIRKGKSRPGSCIRRFPEVPSPGVC